MPYIKTVKGTLGDTAAFDDAVNEQLSRKGAKLVSAEPEGGLMFAVIEFTGKQPKPKAEAEPAPES
jgi:hypothetical protein